MMNAFDADQSGIPLRIVLCGVLFYIGLILLWGAGTISVQEFAKLWTYISQWKQVFDGYDADRSGQMDFNELKQALIGFGYRLSDQFIVMLIRKFDHQFGPNQIALDAFIEINFLLQQMTGAFRSMDTDNDGWVQINYEQFLTVVMQAH